MPTTSYGRGIHTAIVTPFTDTGDLDQAALERVIERQLDAGIHGIVACGTTGEMPTLELDEWKAVVSTAVRLCKGRGPVAAGIGTNNTRSTVKLTEAAAELGADVAMMVLPYYNKPNAPGLHAHVAAAAKVGLPLMLYHVPGRTAQRLDPALLASLTNLEGVCAVKEATGDVRYVGDLCAATKRPVLSGDDFSFLGAMAQGATGCVSVLSNVAPAETVAIYDAFVAGRVGDARDQLAALWALTTFLFSDVSPVPCKAALAHLGVCSKAVRLPLAPYGGPPPAALLASFA